MFRKNVASQFLCFTLVNASTGAILTGATVTAKRKIDGGAQASVTGTVSEAGSSGQYELAMSQADTNGNNIGFLFTATSAIPVSIAIVTTAADPTDAVRFGLTALPANAAGAANGLPVNGTNLGSPVFATTSWGGLTSSQISTYAGGDTAGTTTLLARVTGSVMLASSYTAPDNATIALIAGYTDSIEGRLPAALVGGRMDSVAAVVSDKTGYALTQTFPTNFSALSITAAGTASSDVKYVNAVLINGAGTLLSPFGP